MVSGEGGFESEGAEYQCFTLLADGHKGRCLWRFVKAPRHACPSSPQVTPRPSMPFPSFSPLLLPQEFRA